MAVDIQTGPVGERRVRVAAADSADEDPGIVGAVRLGEGQVRYEFTHLLDVVDALGLHGPGRDGRNGQWQVLQALLTPAGRYDDLLQQTRRGTFLSSRLARRK